MHAWKKRILLLGLVCVGQFYVCALIGIFRGYSVQSSVPFWVMLFGLLLLIFKFASSCSVKCNTLKNSWMSFLVSFTLCFVSILGIYQGKYAKEGDELFEQGKYSEAIEAYQKEIDTWYLRSKYNYHEDKSLFRIGECYCQLGEFDKGREAYRLVAKRYKGLYKASAVWEVAEVDRELANIADLQAKLSSEADDYKKSQILFDIALAYKKVSCNKKAKEYYEMIDALNINQDTKDLARKFAEKL